MKFSNDDYQWYYEIITYQTGYCPFSYLWCELKCLLLRLIGISKEWAYLANLGKNDRTDEQTKRLLTLSAVTGWASNVSYRKGMEPKIIKEIREITKGLRSLR